MFAVNVAKVAVLVKTTAHPSAMESSTQMPNQTLLALQVAHLMPATQSPSPRPSATSRIIQL